MKALITGIGGFVGPYLARNLLSNGYSVFGIERRSSTIPGCECFLCDITDASAVEKVIFGVRPDVIFHLAGQSSVEKSFEEPELTYKIHVEGTNNIFAAIMSCNIRPKVIVISSAEVYGAPEKVPISEDSALSPQSPYAMSRVEQEGLALRYNEEFGIPVIISRSFTHTGPGQRDSFVCPNFAKQVADVKKGVKSVIKVGNLEIKRDFTDVRDMVEAYRILSEHGVPGEVYNSCSGEAHSIGEVLSTLMGVAGVSAMVEHDTSRIRANDIPVLQGDNSKLLALGWKPKISFLETMKSLFEYWNEKV